MIVEERYVWNIVMSSSIYVPKGDLSIGEITLDSFLMTLLKLELTEYK